MIVVRFLIDGINRETAEFDAVPDAGSVVMTRLGKLVVGDVVSRSTEIFNGVGKHKKEVFYINAEKWIAPTPVPEIKPVQQLFGTVAKIHSVKKLSDIGLFFRPSACAGCGKPHGMDDDDSFVIVEADRGILCIDCGKDREPAMRKMVEDYEHFGFYSDESEPIGTIECRAKEGVTLDEMPVELRKLADKIQMKIDYMKEAA